MSTLDELIGAMGTDDFARSLFTLLNERLHIRHMVVDGYDIHLRPVSLYRYSNGAEEELAAIRRTYTNCQLFASDPVVQVVRDLQRKANPNEKVSVHCFVEDSVNPKIYDQLMKKFMIRQRLVYLFRFRQRWLALKMLKMDPPDISDKQELRRIIDEIPSLLHVVGWHSLVFTGAESLRYHESYYRYESLLQYYSESLSSREIEVCARALTGRQNSEIASDLGISEGTVRTLRNRAFSKMNVRSIQQLSTICLSLIDGRS